MKRKPPKNQRAYKTPSGKKARLAELNSDEMAFLADPANQDRIDFPQTYAAPHPDSPRWADAKQLAKWRASQTTSTGEQ
jgi:hypothetical protein